ncbi:PilZ domain-containing protein [Luteimonas sp. 22616]|uniref:PilZ domain-containing protein n=1 Tax=Luteimonas sp. 22616 TaxID=3453951 RepID=UPI003F842E49
MTTPAEAREILFGDILACEEIRPAAFVHGDPGNVTLQSFGTRGEALLRALAVIEDGARSEAHAGLEPEQPADHAMHRIEAKLDLLTLLVASVHASNDSDPLQSLQWSARGACLAIDGPLPAGTSGHFRVRPADWLPSPLLLPASVIACDTGAPGVTRAWLRFGSLSPALEAALERHLFRIHRRSIAESRRPR